MAIRLGVVGLGYGAGVLIPAFRADPRAEIIAVAARRPEKAVEVAAKLGVAIAVPDWRAVIDHPQVDAVVVATPPNTQAGIAAAALTAGKPVFAEKPLAVDGASARALAKLAATKNLAAMVDFNFRAIPEFVSARALLSQNFLGPLWQMSMTWHVESFVNRARLEHWKANADEGGGALGNFVSHSLDLFEWLGEPIATLQARLARFPGDTRNGETLVTLACEFASGGSGSLSMSAAAFGGTGHRIELYGRDGAIVLDNPSTDYVHGFSLRGARRDEDSALRVLASEPWPEAAGDRRILPSARNAVKFLDWVEGGAPQEPDFRTGARVQELMECVRRSAEQGGAVQFAPALV